MLSALNKKMRGTVKTGILVFTVWTAILSSVFLYHSIAERFHTYDEARSEARMRFEKDLLYRRWNAMHGGVYVPVTEQTRPNPYLDIKDREITTPSGEVLTRINPAYMTRQVYELEKKDTTAKSHLTSLKPIRPANAPDDWEKNALYELEKGKKEVSSVEETDGGEFIRLMKPFITEDSCLKCHAFQGYKKGDIRGGISITVPMATFFAELREHLAKTGFGFGLVWFFGTVIIAVSFVRIRRDEDEKLLAQEKFQEQERFISSVLDNSPEFVAVYDLELEDPVYMNRALREPSGYTGKITNDFKWNEFLSVHPADINLLKEHLNRLRESPAGYALSIEFRIRTGSEEEYRWIHAFDSVFERDSSGDTKQILIIAQDITERKISEEILRSSGEWYKQLLNAVTSYTYTVQVKDGKAVSTKHGSGCLTVTGFTSRDYEENPYLWLAMIHEEDRDFIRQQIEKLLSGKKVQPFEHRIIHRDSSLRWVRSTLVPKYDEGRLISYDGIIEDITERRSAEESLRESEARYRTIVENINDALYLHDFKGMIIDVNENSCRMLGYSKEELIYENLSKIGSPENASQMPERMAHLLRDGRILFEGKHIRKDGSSVPIEVSAKIISGEGDGLVQAFVRDITERKHAEMALRESERQFKETLENADLIAVQLDRDGNIIFGNNFLSKITGWQINDIIGRNWMDLFIPAHIREDMRKLHQSNIEENIHRQYENEIVTKNGQERFITWTNSQLFDSAGNVIGITSLGIDITERIRTEAALREEKEYSDSLIRTANVIVVELDKDGNVVLINQSAEKITEYVLDEVKGKNWFETVVPRNRYSQVYDEFRKLSEGGLPKYFKNPILTKTGQERIISWSNSEIRKGGLITGSISFGIDITEQIKLEEQLRQSQKMEAIGLLAGGVAHDFNNILTAIMGYSNMLQRKMKKDDPKVTQVEQILNAAERAAGLTQSLLAFSRKQVINPKPLLVNQVVRKVEKLLRRIIGEDIELKITLDAAPLTVMADSIQIEQVLINLATNARDAMPDGGILTINTGRLVLDSGFVSKYGYGREGSYALISVSDSGKGMDETTRARIFEPFFTTKELGRGTGLGLSIVYGIVRQSEGYINCYSEMNTGTTFKIYLPLIPQEAESAVPETPVEIPRGRETLLIAEDDIVLRNIQKEICEEYGYKVILASDGEDALKKFRENRGKIQLVVLDIVMPRLDGKEAYDEIIKTDPSAKVLFTSGYTSEIIHKKGILDQSVNFISKPSSPEKFLRKVRELLDK